MAHSHIAIVFQTGRGQAVRLPAAYRFDTKEVFLRRDQATGDEILSRRPADWEALFTAVERVCTDGADFLVNRKDGPGQPRELC